MIKGRWWYVGQIEFQRALNCTPARAVRGLLESGWLRNWRAP